MKLNKKSKLKRISIKSFLYEVIDNNYKVYFFQIKINHLEAILFIRQRNSMLIR